MKWHSLNGFKGVRYREHPTRKHGVHKDRYFVIRYQHEGARKEEALGWESEGWTPKRAASELSKLREAHRLGEGAKSLSEKRQLENEKREADQLEQEQKTREEITFADFFKDTYAPILKTTKKPGSVKAENILFEKWIHPIFEKMPFTNIYPIHIERIRKTMQDAGKSPRSIEYTLAIIRQIWNMARRDGLIHRDSPTKQIKKPKINNKRIRFLSHDEADRLLDNLSGRSKQLHDMALLSLHTGLRAGEVFSLTWGNLDIEQRIIYIVDAKGGSRTGYMTERIKEMFKSLGQGEPNELVFKDRRHGGRIKQISSSFDRAVDALGLNSGVTDHRQKVLFHSLRHSFASWLVQQGEPLYTVQKLLGHASISMTERYSHLAPGMLKNAVRNFEKNLNSKNKILPLRKNE